MSLNHLSAAQLRHAADLKEQIEALETELSRLHGAPSALETPVKRTRNMSAAGRARIAAAQKIRWAKAKGQTLDAAAVAKPGRRGPRKMSAEARAKIAAAQKARWAKVRAAKAGK